MRPSDNPLIVHVSDKDMLADLVSSVPKQVAIFPESTPTHVSGSIIDGCFLARTSDTAVPQKGQCTPSVFAPTYSQVPQVVTCGQETVAIRMPSHPIAHTLIKLSQRPIAAPSANLSGRPSPTTAEHVWEDLGERIPCIIDGGPCDVGLESTVVDVNREQVTTFISLLTTKTTSYSAAGWCYL